jgi:hypothetical protein
MLASEREGWSAHRVFMWKLLLWLALICFIVGLIVGYVLWNR